MLPELGSVLSELRVLGISGAQGSGKSTLAAALKELLVDRQVFVLSLDDFYLTKEERRALGREVHPLFETRGAPGTHDIPLALSVFKKLLRGEKVDVPRFDKARDDRGELETVEGVFDLIVFEGWCLGLSPEEGAKLSTPINALERDADPDGVWRRSVNSALGGAYQELFGLIDALLFLKVPGFENVYSWRLKQERQGAGVLSAEEVARFILFYERLTRHALENMQADYVIEIDAEQRFQSIRGSSHA